jgi:hypothetical protein
MLKNKNTILNLRKHSKKYLVIKVLKQDLWVLAQVFPNQLEVCNN